MHRHPKISAGAVPVLPVQAMCCGLESYGAPNTLTQKKYTTHAQTHAEALTCTDRGQETRQTLT